MSTVATFDISSLSKARAMTEEVVVGKDVVELLAGAMYADPLTIFREYVQNAADAIDSARSQGLDPGEGFGVSITLDRAQRTIVVRDNGTSIPGDEFVRRLTSIGASQKRGTPMRGFRGVGRLSGLGYCQEIFFRGRTENDTRVTELRWDVRRLRDFMRDATYTGDLGSLVRSVVDIRKLPVEGYPTRFFEVELRKVTRLRGDLLLNDDSVARYLSQVAPAPFHPDFRFGPDIAAFLEQRGVRAPLDIRIGGREEPIYHRARSDIAFSEKVTDAVQSVEYLEFLDQDGEPSAFGWLLEHAYLGAIPRRSGQGGVRLRNGNVQIGDESTLSHLFVEPRFAGWAIGDIHVESGAIQPNARRDEFESSVAYAYLQDELTIFLKRISQVVRDSSIVRNRVRKAKTLLALADQWLDQAKEQELPAAVQDRVRGIVQERLDEAIKQVEKLDGASHEAVQLRHRIGTVKGRRTQLLKNADAVSGKRSARDKAVDVAIGVILEHAATPAAGLAMSKRVLKAFEAT